MAAFVDRLVLASKQVAHEVALHDGKTPTVVEVGHRDAGRGGVDEVTRDQRTLEAELGVQRHLAEPGAVVGNDPVVGGGVAAHGGVGAVGDAVAGDEDAAGPEDAHAFTVLARAASVGADAHDAVAGHDAAVLAGLRAPHLDTVVAAVGDVVVNDIEAQCVDAADGGLHGGGDGAVGNAAATGLKRDSVGGTAGERQMAQAHAARVADRDEAVSATRVEHLVAAVEDDTFEQDAVGVVGGDEGAAAGELQGRGTGGAYEACAGEQLD
jgi:hypothetical protein